MTSFDPRYRDRAANTIRQIAVEICVDDVGGALVAEQEGADRIELCAALSEGGITPSIGLVQTLFERISHIGVQVMIRPRGGDFQVSRLELGAMLADIAAMMALRRSPNVQLGFVFGALTSEGTIDVATTTRLAAACGDAPKTFHKAFDRVSDLPAALEILIDLGIDRVLTSGGAPNAEAGAFALGGLIDQARDRITILAGGGIRASNARRLVEQTGVSEIHLRAMRDAPGRPPITDAMIVADVIRAVKAAR